MTETQASQRRTSLLQAFLRTAALVFFVFVCLIFGVWFYTTNIIERGETLISQAVPELNTAYELTIGTAQLQSQTLLMPLSENIQELGRRSDALEGVLNDVRRVLKTHAIESNADLEKLNLLTEQLGDLVAKLVSNRSNALELEGLVARQRARLNNMLLQIEKEVRQELVILIDLFLSNSLLLSDELSSDTTGERASSNSAQELLSNIEGYALLVQDFELLNQDLVSLQALVNRVPLIREQQDMLLSEQTRDLLIKKIFNRAVYLNDLRAEKALLAQMAELRGELRADDSLFVNRQQSLIVNRELTNLRDGLSGVTREILQRAESIKTYADTSLQTVSNDTTQGLKRYQQFLVLFAVISMLLLGFISYRLLFRNMAAPLSLITERLHRVGTPDYGEDRQHHVIEEVAELSAAVSQLDAAQRSMKQQDHMLQASNAELLRANRDLEQFAHVASHDLQEPLRKMQQFSALLKEDYEEILKGDGALYLNVISSSSQRMRTLINDTLEYSRTATSKQAMERVDLADVISYLQQELDLLIDESEAAVEIEALPMVYANRTGMRQLFRNLITNAIKYAKAGVAPRIQIASHTDTQNHQFIIDVRDNGMGVPSQYAERIFKPFERLVDRSIEGTGLGLPICRKVCDAHGWTIELTSTEGEGSCFSIHGPLSSIVALEKAS